MVFGYNVKDETKEITTELKGSRNTLILLFLGALGGTLASRFIAEIKPFRKLKEYLKRPEYEEE